jgi:Tol biopolymer transport system component
MARQRGRIKRLTPLIEPNGRVYAESNPSWTPDGRMLFWSHGYGIATVAPSGGAPVPIASSFPNAAHGSHPVMSPDGRSILYSTRAFLPRTTRCSIWVVSTAGTNAHDLIPDGCNAVWSPDGSRIAFVVGDL